MPHNTIQCLIEKALVRPQYLYNITQYRPILYNTIQHLYNITQYHPMSDRDTTVPSTTPRLHWELSDNSTLSNANPFTQDMWTGEGRRSTMRINFYSGYVNRGVGGDQQWESTLFGICEQGRGGNQQWESDIFFPLPGQKDESNKSGSRCKV